MIEILALESTVTTKQVSLIMLSALCSLDVCMVFPAYSHSLAPDTQILDRVEKSSQKEKYNLEQRSRVGTAEGDTKTNFCHKVLLSC